MMSILRCSILFWAISFPLTALANDGSPESLPENLKIVLLTIGVIVLSVIIKKLMDAPDKDPTDKENKN